MRVLLDECLPRRLKRQIVGHDVATVPELGWAGIKNGELLRRAGEAFDAFVTVDRNLSFQQRVGVFPGESRLGVVVLVVSSNRLEALLPLVAGLHDALAELRPGGLVRVGPAVDA